MNKTKFCLIFSLSIFGTVATCGYYSMLPYNFFSWACLTFVSISTLIFLSPKISAYYSVVYIVFYAYLCFGSVAFLSDISGDREGIFVHPNFIFAKCGNNSDIIKKNLGYLPKAEWVFYYHHINASGNYIEAHSLIIWDIKKVLKLLPDNESQVKVLQCLTTPSNLMRVHQNQLLAALSQFGYPDGYNADSWWQYHGKLFYIEHDLKKAEHLTMGWVLCWDSRYSWGRVLDDYQKHFRKVGYTHHHITDYPKSEWKEVASRNVVWWWNVKK